MLRPWILCAAWWGAGISFLAAGPGLEGLRAWLADEPASRPPLEAEAFAHAPLGRAEAAEAADFLWADHLRRLRLEREAEMREKRIRIGDLEMPFEYRVFGDKPEGGRSLYISMHGGGNAPPRVNEQQWRNQIGLYEPAEGVYVAPRAPTDTWNLWHEAHIDAFFDRLIADFVVFEEVDLDRVYLMGYSAGGDGVFQLAPRMADRWAAAAMMAGHPNETVPLGLRNLGFTLHMGGEDGAYNRNTVAAEWKKRLAYLNDHDPGGYRHEVVIHEGLGHWMERKDAVAVPWMAQWTRNPVPERIVWVQDDVTHSRSYWLAVGDEDRRAGTQIRAVRQGQQIEVEADGVKRVTILLDDRVADLDAPVTVVHGGRPAFSGTVERRVSELWRSLQERGDRGLMFCARLPVELE